MKRKTAEILINRITNGRVNGFRLIVTADDLRKRGFKEVTTRGSCVYYINPDCDYAVAFIKDDMVLMPSWLPKEIGYCSIFFNCRKYNDKAVPMIRYENKNKYLHKVMMESKGYAKDLSYDHINVCRNCCNIENLRPATSQQNTGNMSKVLDCAYSCSLCFQFCVHTTKRQDKKLKGLGLTLNKKGNKTEITSPVYKDKNTWFANMKAAQKIIYKEFLYDICNDFSHEYGIHLLIHRDIFKDVTEDEARKFNYEYWRGEYSSSIFAKRVFEYAVA